MTRKDDHTNEPPDEPTALASVRAILGAVQTGPTEPPPLKDPSTETLRRMRERITEALTGKEWLAEDALLNLLDPLRYEDNPRLPPLYDRDARHAADIALSELVREGIVGRSYAYENLGNDDVGRVYYVWLRTPETDERDRGLFELDKTWAEFTGGAIGYDAELLGQ